MNQPDRPTVTVSHEGGSLWVYRLSGIISKEDLAAADGQRHGFHHGLGPGGPIRRRVGPGVGRREFQRVDVAPKAGKGDGNLTITD